MKETWNEFRTEFFLRKLFPTRHNACYDFLVPKRLQAIQFIENLLKNGVSLEQIDINDWNCTTLPKIFVGSGQYTRFAKNDYKLALKRINS